MGWRPAGLSVAEFLLDTEAASRVMRAERSVVAKMRQPGD
jgi:hypothetical protein